MGTGFFYPIFSCGEKNLFILWSFRVKTVYELFICQ